MGITVDLSGVYKKISNKNMMAGQRAVANQALVDMNENFVPKRDGHLRDSATISMDGSKITWNAPYAGPMYRGIITNKSGSYPIHNWTTPGTGAYWDQRAKGVFMSDWVQAFKKGAAL